MIHFKSSRLFLILLIIGVFSVSGSIFSQGIVIDHTCTDIAEIPGSWIDKVKSMLKVHYAHTSHGEQITVGLERLSNADSKYSYYPDNCTVPQTTQYLSLMDGQYLFDGGYCETYISPDLYWEGSYGLNTTRSVLNSFAANISLWAWCSQLDYYSQAGVQAYLDAMTQLEQEYPDVTFIYMTGNAQGEEQNRYARNNQIRNYCRNNDKILFDFADLDCWYNGQQYTVNGIPMEHPQYYGDEAGHTTYRSCENKAKAFWWLLARIAGWDGSGGGGTGTDLPPFGSFDTPLEGSNVRSSIAVTGWALDDTAVENVKVYRQSGNDLVYIGDATFVEGARPDIAALYPGYPNNSRAGWGYMMLTHFLPNGGNGTYTFCAVAADGDGHQVTLGSKTVTCDNDNAVKPFGAIDTPAQGGTASGSGFVNQGWALTPQPNRIPTDGSTIDVWVDGVNLGQPTYNIHRSDVAALFPEYANAAGAGGSFYIDTTAYEDGVHTIFWTAADNAGNSDGIGSRFFIIQNDAERKEQSAGRKIRGGLSRMPVDYPEPVRIKKGYNKNIYPQTIYPGDNGNINIEIKELQRIEIHFATSTSIISPLPVGSTMDIKGGVFYWIPGPGFLGTYEFVFIAKNSSRLSKVVVNIFPKYPLEE